MQSLSLNIEKQFILRSLHVRRLAERTTRTVLRIVDITMRMRIFQVNVNDSVAANE